MATYVLSGRRAGQSVVLTQTGSTGMLTGTIAATIRGRSSLTVSVPFTGALSGGTTATIRSLSSLSVVVGARITATAAATGLLRPILFGKITATLSAAAPGWPTLIGRVNSSSWSASPTLRYGIALRGNITTTIRSRDSLHPSLTALATTSTRLNLGSRPPLTLSLQGGRARTTVQSTTRLTVQLPAGNVVRATTQLRGGLHISVAARGKSASVGWSGLTIGLGGTIGSTSTASSRLPTFGVGLFGGITTTLVARAGLAQRLVGVVRSTTTTRGGLQPGLTARIVTTIRANTSVHTGTGVMLSGRIRATTRAPTARLSLLLAGGITTTVTGTSYIIHALQGQITTISKLRPGITTPVPPPPPPPLPVDWKPLCQELPAYLDLITSFHNQRPRYMGTVALSVMPEIDAQCLALSILGMFDLDTANGQQLDFVGQWVGVSRTVQFVVDPWFSFDTINLGFDLGKWKVPYEETTGQTILDDDSYRLLLYARVAANYWDGTIPGAYTAWETLFQMNGYQILLQDNLARIDTDCHGDMSLIQALLGPPLTPVTLQLFVGGYLGLKSAGVRVNYMVQDQTPGTGGIGKPLFGFDVGPTHPPALYPPTTLAGFDMGGWGQLYGPTGDTGPPIGTQPVIPDAPADGNLYARQQRNWIQTLPIPGGTVTGTLRLAGQPANPTDASNKQYADNRDAGSY